MRINDRIFGRHHITSSVILELIASSPVQRLKRIGQAGQPRSTDPRPYRYTRYDHCIGVMLLLKILGATEEEQIAGLLHDVSHTAFSHTIDFVLERGKEEDFQDSQHEKYILSSEIPTILEKYHYDVHRMYDYHHFTLLEQDLPHLCADRVDYSLRESPASLTKMCLPSLRVYKGRIVFSDKNAATLFARQFLKLQETSWGGVEHVTREQIFAKALSYALKKKILTMDDFWTDDETVLSRLTKIHDRNLARLFTLMNKKEYHDLPRETMVQKKFRFVDPDILVEGKLQSLSEVDHSYEKLLRDARKRNEEGVLLPDVENLLSD